MVEGQRPDLTFIDTQPMTYSWYLKKQRQRFDDLIFPGSRYGLQGPDTFKMADLVKSNPNKSFFGCINLQGHDLQNT